MHAIYSTRLTRVVTIRFILSDTSSRFIPARGFDHFCITSFLSLVQINPNHVISKKNCFGAVLRINFSAVCLLELVCPSLLSWSK